MVCILPPFLFEGIKSFCNYLFLLSSNFYKFSDSEFYLGINIIYYLSFLVERLDDNY